MPTTSDNSDNPSEDNNNPPSKLFNCGASKINEMPRKKIFCFLLFYVFGNVAQCRRQNIVLIIGDDMGWNDVGFHGSSQIPTPNIDALGYNGVIFHRFYTQPTCTPSRAALLTGNYPIRSGMQGYPMKSGENRFLPPDMPTLPEHLKRLGYRTHLIGKWHLGYACKKYTPIGRGFDSHYGYWNGFIGYYNHSTIKGNFAGHDMHDGFDPDFASNGHYATDLFTKKARGVIKNHDRGNPLFLVVSHLAPHAGLDDSLEVPDVRETNEKFAYITDERRRLYAGVVYRLDQSVGQIVTELSEQGMLNDTVVMYISDNGGQTFGMHHNAASNWPLKGLKLTLFEGGVRGTAVLYSSALSRKGTVNNNLIHISDLMPTLYEAAGGEVQDLGKIDGKSQWSALRTNQKTKREHILVEVDELDKMSAIIGYYGKYKLVNGTFQDGVYDLHSGDPGRAATDPPYNFSGVLQSAVNSAVKKLKANENLTEAKIRQMRSQVDLSGCGRGSSADLTCKDPCLFNLESDPCEWTNVASDYPKIVKSLARKLRQYESELVPQGDHEVDPNSHPGLFNNAWTTWLENKTAN